MVYIISFIYSLVIPIPVNWILEIRADDFASLNTSPQDLINALTFLSQGKDVDEPSFTHPAIVKRIERLEKTVEQLKRVVLGSSREAKQLTEEETAKINFSLNIRTFINRYAADKSRPKRFVLLLAHIAKGEIGRNIEIEEIRKQWNTMSAKNLLGKYNRFYPNEAKTQGWVDSKKYGTYCLTDEWRKAYE